jgi:hypothetical protein
MPLIAEMPAQDTPIERARPLVTPWRVAVLLSLALAVPVALFPLGMAGDYLNHLARNAIEARIWFDAAIARHYTFEFAIIPDIAMDLVVPWLSHLTGIHAAGAVMVWAALTLPPLAGLLIAQTIHGRAGWLTLAGFLAVFNENTQWGFVNFLFSTGLALVGLALWMRGPTSWLRITGFATFGLLLAFCHALGFLLFGFLVLMWEIGNFAAGERGSVVHLLRTLATRAAPAMLPGLAVVALGTGKGQELVHASTLQFALDQKIASLWAGSLFFNVALAKLVAIVFGIGAWLALRHGLLSIDKRMAWVCGGLAILIVVMPTSIFGIWGLHFRYQAVLMILVAASVRLAPGHERFARSTGLVLTGLLAAVLLNATLTMSRIDALAQANRTLVSAIPEGARVLPARDDSTNVLLTLHAVSIAVVERSAFVPSLFTNTSPVGVQPAMRRQHMPQGWPLLEDQLAASMELTLPEAANGFWSPQFFFDWPRHWDYVLFFRNAEDQRLDLPHLCEAGAHPGAILYQVAPGSCDEQTRQGS